MRKLQEMRTHKTFVNMNNLALRTLTSLNSNPHKPFNGFWLEKRMDLFDQHYNCETIDCHALLEQAITVKRWSFNRTIKYKFKLSKQHQLKPSIIHAI